MPGNITQFADAARIVDGRQLTDLNSDFTLNNTPFSIQLVPKSPDNTQEFERVMIKLYQSQTYQLWPLPILAWCSEMVIGIGSISAPLLDEYDIYIGTGADIPNN